MPSGYDYSDLAGYDDARAMRNQQRALSHWRCPECRGGIGSHSQFCPEAIGEDEAIQGEEA